MRSSQTLSTVKHILRALRYRNYRLFFLGQTISLTGTWMEHMAMGWLVYRLTNSAFALGAIGFTSSITTFFISPFAGVWADRLNRRRIVLAAQVLLMVQALVLAALVLTGVVRVWHIVVLSLFLGLINSFDMPVRQSFTIDLIENKADLGNAIALNSLMFNSARFVGPTIAGIVVAAFGEGVCFLLNGLSYLAVIVALMSMKVPEPVRKADRTHILKSMKEGFVYTFNLAPMRFVLMLLGLVSLVVMPYAVLLPVFARDVLSGNSRTLGFLMGASGMGALCGAIFLASRRSVAGLGKMIAAAAFLLGAGLVIFSFTRQIWFSLLLMVFVGFGVMVHVAASNTVLQTLVDDDKRGRVMSVYVMAFIGLTPFGSLMAGSLASSIGTPWTIAVAGCCCMLGAGVFARHLSSFARLIDKADLVQLQEGSL